MQAVQPIYDHVFMALPIFSAQTDKLFEELLSFLWTHQKEGQTVQKRRLVAKNRIAANLEMGGQQIFHPQQTIQGLQQNLIQKLFKKTLSQEETKLLQLLESALISIGRPSLETHAYHFGPQQWERTAKLLEQQNVMFAQAFSSIGIFLELLEDELDSWGSAAIYGHSKTSKLFPLSPADHITLRACNLSTISQLFIPNDSGTISRNLINYFTQPFPLS